MPELHGAVDQLVLFEPAFVDHVVIFDAGDCDRDREVVWVIRGSGISVSVFYNVAAAGVASE
jgi:hypothetical protein